VVESQEESVETALWTALRALQERAQLSQRLADRVGKAGAEPSRRRFTAVAEEAREQAETIRRILVGPDDRED
jgi:two-component system, chemotaxis family, protein-glutamate methylesterase/glutaminase